MSRFQNPNISWFNDKFLLESRTLGCTRNSVKISAWEFKYFHVPNWQCNCVSLVFPLRESKFVASPNTTVLYPPPLHELEKQTENSNQLKPSQGRRLGCLLRVQTIAVTSHVAGIIFSFGSSFRLREEVSCTTIREQDLESSEENESQLCHSLFCQVTLNKSFNL